MPTLPPTGDCVALSWRHGVALYYSCGAYPRTTQGGEPKLLFYGVVRANFDLTPKAMITALKLRRPIYRKTAAFGHFGRTENTFTWEATDRAKTLKDAAHATAAAR